MLPLPCFPIEIICHVYSYQDHISLEVSPESSLSACSYLLPQDIQPSDVFSYNSRPDLRLRLLFWLTLQPSEMPNHGQCPPGRCFNILFEITVDPGNLTQYNCMGFRLPRPLWLLLRRRLGYENALEGEVSNSGATSYSRSS